MNWFSGPEAPTPPDVTAAEEVDDEEERREKQHAGNSPKQNTKQNTTRHKQNRTSTPTLHKKTPSTTPHKQITNPTRIPTQNHNRNSHNTNLSPMPLTDTRHKTTIQLPKVADRPRPQGAGGPLHQARRGEAGGLAGEGLGGGLGDDGDDANDSGNL